jgi:hypothetical protein
MRTLLATFALIALSTGAQAYCFPVPDDASSGYVENDLQRTICIQDELAQTTSERAQQSQLNSTLSKLQRDLQQQKFKLLQLETSVLMSKSKL